MNKTVRYKKFETSSKEWESLFAEAAEFATSVGEENLISVSHSDSEYLVMVTVWFWNE